MPRLFASLTPGQRHAAVVFCLFALCFLAVSAFVLFSGGKRAPVAMPNYPPLTGYIVDDAGILSDGAQREIKRFAQGLEKSAGAKLAVGSFKDLQGADIEHYARGLRAAWGADIVLVIVPEAAQARLEGRIETKLARAIMAETLVPGYALGRLSSITLDGIKRIEATPKGNGGATGNWQSTDGK